MPGKYQDCQKDELNPQVKEFLPKLKKGMKPRKGRLAEGKEERFNTEIKGAGFQILFGHTEF